MWSFFFVLRVTVEYKLDYINPNKQTLSDSVTTIDNLVISEWNF